MDFGDIILFPSVFFVATLELTYRLALGVDAVMT
jgi:hypothetical protein